MADPRWLRLARRRQPPIRDQRAAALVLQVLGEALPQWGEALGRHASNRFFRDVMPEIQRIFKAVRRAR